MDANKSQSVIRDHAARVTQKRSKQYINKGVLYELVDKMNGLKKTCENYTL